MDKRDVETLVAGLRGSRDEEGATAVEYGLLVALIAAIIIGVVGFLGADVLNAFDTMENALFGDGNPAPTTP
jgi:pilus assembly protein Flp/PilA